MKNKAVVVNAIEIAIAGEISAGINQGGIFIKPSDQSEIKYWMPFKEVEKVILPDATVVAGEDLYSIIEILDKFNTHYGLGGN